MCAQKPFTYLPRRGPCHPLPMFITTNKSTGWNNVARC